MAKIRDQPVASSDIESYLNSQDDFALEMRTYSLVESLGFNSTHGGTYDDPVTKKPRQFDIRANLERDMKRIDVAVECKSLKPSYPLVVSRIPRLESESYHEVVCSFKRSEGLIYRPEISPCQTLRVAYTNSAPFYKEFEPVGKSTTQIGVSDKGDFVSGDSEVFDKWTQALGSLSELAAASAWYRKKNEVQLFLTTLLPVLVIPDGTLWVADYDTAGNLMSTPKLADSTTVFMGRDLSMSLHGAYNVSHLHVVTFSGATNFFCSISQSDDVWDMLFPNEELFRLHTEA